MDTPRILLEPRFTAVRGCLPGIGQPSLHAFVKVDARLAGDNAFAERFADATARLLPSDAQPPHPPQPVPLPAHLLAACRRVFARAGWPIGSDGIWEPAGAPGRFGLAVPFLDGCADEATRTLAWVIDLAAAVAGGGPRAEVEARLGPLVAALGHVGPQGMNTRRFLEAAMRRGIPWRRVSSNVFQFGQGAESRWFDSSYTEQSLCIAAKLARSKYDTAVVLRRAGIPVPRHELVTRPEAAVEAAGRIGYPVVVKPVDRDGGKGVAVELTTPEAVRQATVAALGLSVAALVEQFIPGNDYRIQVHRGRMVWASHRVPGGVTGDGERTVAALLAALNADPARGEPGSTTLLKRIAFDDEARDLLAMQGLTLESVPEQGRVVRLRRAANVASGGTATGVLETVHPDNAALAARAAAALRLDPAGIDLLIPDISRSWLEGGAAVCEVNAQPQLWPTLPETILGEHVRGEGRIPIVIVMGAAGDEAMVAAVAQSLATRGAGIAFAGRAGTTLGAETILRGPADLLAAGEAALFDRRVAGLVAFVDDDRMLQAGLPCDRFDLLVLTGGPADPAAWPAWRGSAARLARACTGPIVTGPEPAPWRPLAAAIAPRQIAALASGDLRRMMETCLGRRPGANPGSR